MSTTWRPTVSALLNNVTGYVEDRDKALVARAYGKSVSESSAVLQLMRHDAKGAKKLQAMLTKVREEAAGSLSFGEFLSALCLRWCEDLYAGRIIVPELLALRRQLQSMQFQPRIEDGESVPMIRLLAHVYGNVKLARSNLASAKAEGRPACGSDTTVQFRKTTVRKPGAAAYHQCDVVQTDVGTGGCDITSHALPGCFLGRDLGEAEPTPKACSQPRLPPLWSPPLPDVRGIATHHSRVAAAFSAEAAADEAAWLELASEDAGDLSVYGK